ncbi:6508_t:CDS:2 [Cetraspora pellucida]|uniref:6508_t:CDS:1 n=1 Tax=Cetraspora pellucida TaxID=1433469 RepID=A0A9N9EKC2_9GLOM|nr:6508_t:CDS:2 [Cetraspora pellucida]
MESDNCGDSFKSLCFQYPCKYGIECSGYHLEPNNEILYEDTEILNENLVKQTKKLVLNTDKKFDTWDLADKFIDDYTKQEGFSICKKRHTLDPKDNIIIKRRIYECSYAGTHEPQKKF